MQEHLRYRSDFEFFKYEIDTQNLDQDIKKIMSKLGDTVPENPSPAEMLLLRDL